VIPKGWIHMSMTDKDFVWKLTEEGIGYSLLNYFGSKEIEARQDPELKKSVLTAQKALIELDSLLQSKYADDVSGA
jgi:hypothetical protein